MASLSDMYAIFLYVEDLLSSEVMPKSTKAVIWGEEAVGMNRQDGDAEVQIQRFLILNDIYKQRETVRDYYYTPKYVSKFVDSTLDVLSLALSKKAKASIGIDLAELADAEKRSVRLFKKCCIKLVLDKDDMVSHSRMSDKIAYNYEQMLLEAAYCRGLVESAGERLKIASEGK